MKLFQCSSCARLDINDVDDACFRTCGCNPNPKYRGQDDKDECERSFKPLSEKQQWHERFSWER